MADTKDSDGPISRESIDALEDARKGKPRKFVLICKGTSIRSLVVYKKGSVEKYIKEARETGTGQVFYGVISGKSQNLNFQLSREDGFERPPVKTQVLRDFLKDNAELALKPLFEIVDGATSVLDEDDELDRRFLQLRDAALAAADRHSDRAPDVNRLCREIARFIDQDDARQAEKQLDALEKLLEELRRSKDDHDDEHSLRGSERVGSQADDAQSLAKFTSLFKKLKPRIDDALTVKGPAATELKRLSVEAAHLAKSHDGTAALEKLAQLEVLLDEFEAASQDWKTRLAAIEARYLDAIAANPPDVSKLRTIMGYAQEHAEHGEFQKALVALTRLEPFLSGASGGGAAESRKKALASYESARTKVLQQLTQLAHAIKEADEPDARNALIEIKAIHAQLSSKPDSRRSVDELIRYLETDDVVADADMPNKFDIEVDIQVPLLEALDELRETMPA